MTGKVVLVLLDGLGDRWARARMGYLEHLVEEEIATRYTSRCVLPTNSRPNYESLHTGVPPAEHGISSNGVVRTSNMPNIFGLARAEGLTTAAVALSWFSELYHKAPYDPMTDVEHDDFDSPITYGRFHQSFVVPDEETIFRAVVLSKRFDPTYLLVHLLGIDVAGHGQGRDSAEYNRAATSVDERLARAIPAWLELGYSVWVTADHGHDAYRTHGGTTDDVRNVPFYGIRDGKRGLGDRDSQISHLQMAPTLCEALNLDPPSSMLAAPFDW